MSISFVVGTRSVLVSPRRTSAHALGMCCKSMNCLTSLVCCSSGVSLEIQFHSLCRRISKSKCLPGDWGVTYDEVLLKSHMTPWGTGLVIHFLHDNRRFRSEWEMKGPGSHWQVSYSSLPREMLKQWSLIHIICSIMSAGGKFPFRLLSQEHWTLEQNPKEE